MTVDLKKWGPVISDREIGEEVYNAIKAQLQNGSVSIDFKDVISMATYNAKQIFGKLYIELGAEKFFKSIEMRNVNQDLKLIIKMGIESAIEEK